ncbi:MAG: peptidoglycan DD-metalloendopeptidase family protein, partial [Planktothrix sp.]
GEGVGSMAGTSVATAKVTGAISQVWAANPSLSYRQVIEIIKNTATDLGATDFDIETGAGLLNMVAAVQLAKATQPEEEVAQDLQFIPLTWNGEGLVTPMERATNPTSSITGIHQSNGNPEQPITWETFLNIFGAYSSPNWLSFLRNTFDTFYSTQSQNPTTAKNKLIFYDRDSGENEFYRVNDNGSMTRISQGSGWRKTWDMIIPGNFNGDGKSNLLFYDRDTGAHEFYRVNDNGSITRISQGSGWRKTWDMIIPGDFNGDGKTTLLFYDRDRGDYEFYRVNDNGSITRISQGSGWRKTWDMIIPGDFNGDGKTTLLFYDRDRGDYEFYRVNNNGSMTRIRQGSGWRKTWDMIIPGDFNGDGKTTLLFYDRDRGDYEFYRVNDNGSITRIRQGSGWRKTWDMIIPGDFNGDGKNTLLFYDRDRGDYEFYRVNNNGSMTRIGQGSGWRKTWDMIIPEAAEVKRNPVGGSYYPNIKDSINQYFSNISGWSNKSLTEKWDRIGGDSSQYGKYSSYPSYYEWTKAMPPEVLSVYEDLSKTVVGNANTVTTGYAYDRGYHDAGYGAHSGIDISTVPGNAIRSATKGQVVSVENRMPNGWWIAIDELNNNNERTGRRWWYGHLNSSYVQVGQQVSAAQNIGATGDGTPPRHHLHLVAINTYKPVSNWNEVINGKGGTYEQNVLNVLSRTMSPLQAYWNSRNGIKE